NVILAAREAAKLCSCAVDVVETTNVGQAVAALPYFEPTGDPAAVVARMREAAGGAHALEVTRATRDATMDGIAVKAGDAIALVDGRIVARADDVVEALARGADALRAQGVGILTLFVGAEADGALADRAVERLRACCPEAEIEVKDGGQPYYPFLVAAE
ncbi:MAG TPA: hypothetical protein VFM93_12745, partial [Candidatus Limnocylindria bacterium]|nr:hypothetical protein [Candidatus Limnocylindria bacterium]